MLCQKPVSIPKSNYELSNCNNFNIRYWSWNYRGRWHQTCPQTARLENFAENQDCLGLAFSLLNNNNNNNNNRLNVLY